MFFLVFSHQAICSSDRLKPQWPGYLQSGFKIRSLGLTCSYTVYHRVAAVIICIFLASQRHHLHIPILHIAYLHIAYSHIAYLHTIYLHIVVTFQKYPKVWTTIRRIDSVHNYIIYSVVLCYGYQERCRGSQHFAVRCITHCCSHGWCTVATC